MYLQSLGVQPGVLVGICMERSLAMVVGVLGILKAGGAYVPLDPDYPVERLELILRDADLPVVLSDGRHVETLSKPGNRVVSLDLNWERISQESEDIPVGGASPDDLAYVIYTSGSTGKPKGVEITHRGLRNFVDAACAAFCLDPADRVLQFASLSFDTAAEEIFPCLVRGATLVLRTNSMLNSFSTFLQKCADWHITILDLPTAFWHEITERLASDQLTLPGCLRLLIIGGEKANPERLALWCGSSANSVKLLNTYGPTEATVVATIWELGESARRHGPQWQLPIGRPIANTQVYLLDSNLEPVPRGVTGEVYVGGVSLARGYLNRPELTAEKFVPNPFSEQAGSRLFRTGDLARYLLDGNIEFVDRADHQIKLRGFRIELGEIEAVVRQHSAVRETIVVIHENDSGDKQLVGYVVPSQEQSPTVAELCNFLNQKLPNYMIPSAFVFLSALPLTPNGKVDRRALPAPNGTRLELVVAPRTPVERQIAAIWTEVLKLEGVGIDDNFFDLGGHSLLAIRVISRVREVFQMEVPLRSLFEMPTVAGLADVINKVSAADSENSGTRILSVPRHQHRATLTSLRSKGSDVRR